jgi:Peptidase M50B-like
MPAFAISQHPAAALHPLSGSMAVLVGLAAFAAVALQGLWGVAQHVNTIAHEGTHAIVGFGAGNKITKVELKPDGTGRTYMPAGVIPGDFTITFAGYVGPSAIGLLMAKMITLGEITEVLWLAVIGLAILLPLISTDFGRVYVIVTGLVLFLVAAYSTAGVKAVVAYGIAWFLLLSSIRKVLQRRWNAGDAANLRDLTHLPRVLWALLWLILTVAALAKGGSLLV